MPVNIFMSGSGTNAVKILEVEQSLRDGPGSPFTVAAICADNLRSNAEKIGSRFGLPVFMHDLDDFCNELGTVRRDRSVRPAYFKMVMEDLKAQGIGSDLVVLAGYMIVVTKPLLDKLIINVHPADLSIRDSNGKAVYIGDRAVRDAILDGRKEIRASTHIVTEETDQGPVLAVSAPVKVELPENFDGTEESLKLIADEHQKKLKEVGDWVILPWSIIEIAKGNFARQDGVVYYLSQPIPHGYSVSTQTPIV